MAEKMYLLYHLWKLYEKVLVATWKKCSSIAILLAFNFYEVRHSALSLQLYCTILSTSVVQLSLIVY